MCSRCPLSPAVSSEQHSPVSRRKKNPASYRPQSSGFCRQIPYSTTISPKEGLSKARATQHEKCLPCSNHSFRLIFDDLFSFLPAPISIRKEGNRGKCIERVLIPELLWIHLCRMACSFRLVRVFFRGLSPGRRMPSSVLIIHDCIYFENSNIYILIKYFSIGQSV